MIAEDLYDMANIIIKLSQNQNDYDNEIFKVNELKKILSENAIKNKLYCIIKSFNKNE